MLPYEGIYFFADVDGTLLTQKKELLPAVRDALCRFVDGGGRFGLATGRSPHNIDFYRELLPCNAPCIFFNGAAIYDYDTQRYLYRHPMPKQWLLRALRESVALLPDVCAQIFTEHAIYEVNPNGVIDPYRAFEPFPVTHCAPEEIPEDWMKLVLTHHDAALLDRLEQAVDAGPYLDADLRICRSGEFYFEFLASTKGDALTAARGLFPDTRRFLAMGDYMNDLDMVRRADIGGAPANANEAVQQAADLCTCDCDHGAVAEFLQKAVFERT